MFAPNLLLRALCASPFLNYANFKIVVPRRSLKQVRKFAFIEDVVEYRKIEEAHKMEFLEGLTFDDVLLCPHYSEVVPTQTDLTSRFTRKITVRVPLVSAAMDTVTESAMAKSLARVGGIGVIHKNMSIAKQAEQIDLVKRTENGIIFDPVSIHPGMKVKEAERLMREYKIGGLPVIDHEKTLLGIVTNRDIRFEDDENRLVEDLMTPFDRLVVAKSGISLEEAKKVLHRHKVEKLPIIDDQRKIVGLITIKDIKSVVEFPNASRDSKGRLMVAGAVGTSDDTMERVRALIAAGVDAIVVDTAHGHSKNVVNRVAEIKRLYPQMQVIAGNIATYEAALSLHQAGADAVKVGIGPGSICTTRIVAGVGVPQLSAIFDCAKASRELDLPIIADGGIRYSGDIAKALAAGASTVMIGSIFAGAEESPGETIIYDGRTFKAYRGMGSIGAMQAGSSDRYNQFGINAEKLVPEGVEGMLPFKGRVSDIVYQLCGGLRSGMGYCGAATIPQLQQNARFVRITPAGMKESRPHDISITKDSPNYRFQI